MEQQKKPMIAICIPHKGTFYAHFVTETLVPLVIGDATGAQTWCNKGLITNYGVNVDVQRNKLVEEALKFCATHVFFLDSDMMFEGITPMQGLKMLYDMDVPIASGIARLRRPLIKNDNLFPYAMFFEDPPGSGMFKSPKDEYVTLVSAQNPIIEPDMIGTFCCLIRMAVFEELPKPWFKYYYEGDHEIGEDFYFCRAARQAGFKISVNTNVKLDHMATFALTNNMQFRSVEG